MKLFQLLILLLIAACNSNLPRGKKADNDEVIFSIKGYREYGWTEYGSDSIKLKNPVPTVVAIYWLEYKLNANELIAYKLTGKSYSVKEILYQKPLTKQQSKLYKQVMAKADMDYLAEYSSTYGIDDGFYINVIMTKGTKSRKIFWSNKYVPELVKLLSIVNDIAPEKYKFYQDDKKDQFINYLKSNTIKE